LTDYKATVNLLLIILPCTCRKTRKTQCRPCNLQDPTYIDQLLHTSVTTSDLGNLHATSVLQPHRCYTDRPPELTSPTALSDALLLPSGTLWTL